MVNIKPLLCGKMNKKIRRSIVQVLIIMILSLIVWLYRPATALALSLKNWKINLRILKQKKKPAALSLVRWRFLC